MKPRGCNIQLMQDKVRFHSNVHRIQADRPTVLLIMMNIYPHRDSFAKIYMNKKRFKHVTFQLFLWRPVFFPNFISDKSRTGKTVFRNETYWLLFSLVLKDLKELKIRKYSTLRCETICRNDRLVLLTKEQMDVCFRGEGGNKFGVELRNMID